MKGKNFQFQKKIDGICKFTIRKTLKRTPKISIIWINLKNPNTQIIINYKKKKSFNFSILKSKNYTWTSIKNSLLSKKMHITGYHNVVFNTVWKKFECPNWWDSRFILLLTIHRSLESTVVCGDFGFIRTYNKPESRWNQIASLMTTDRRF